MSRNANKKKLTSDESLEVNEFYQKRLNENAFDISKLNINFKCKNENQKKFINLIKDKIITIGSGYPGTGKTFVACAEALRLVKMDKMYKKILLVKSVTDLKGEEIGFIKGSIADKMQPYMESFKDNFREIIGDEITDYLEKLNIIQVQPLSYIRGRTFNNSIIIIDESQNLSYDAMKSILTRIGRDSKMILIGDCKQIDLSNKKTSSFQQLISKFKSNELFGVVEFGKEDQVRNPIINVIEEIFEERENNI